MSQSANQQKRQSLRWSVAAGRRPRASKSRNRSSISNNEDSQDSGSGMFLLPAEFLEMFSGDTDKDARNAAEEKTPTKRRSTGRRRSNPEKRPSQSSATDKTADAAGSSGEESPGRQRPPSGAARRWSTARPGRRGRRHSTTQPRIHS